ncbi:MAG TPA: hypothetical protein PLB63_08340 [Planctomycetota bacterium]|nr:hypothetical protein [Planctomycetota bacterium]HQB01012.1 hypothetical protein [Planctomycetota bacterium]
MIFLLCSVFCFSVFFLGLGYLFLRVTKWQYRFNPFLIIFIGFGVAGMYFSTISLFFALRTRTLLPLVVISFIGLYYFWKEKRQLLIPVLPSFVLFSIVFYFFVSAYARGSDNALFDTKAYHATIIKWMNHYPVVPGLANLHGRLGFNSLYLHLAAGMNVSIFYRQVASLLPALFYCTFFNLFFYEFLHHKRYQIFSLIMMVWCLATHHIVIYLTLNLNYDNSCMMYIAIVIYELMLIFDQRKNQTTDETMSMNLLFFLASISFCIKQMGAINVIFVFFIALYFLYKDKWSSLRSDVEVYESRIFYKSVLIDIFSLCALPIFLFIIYIIRNLIQTGYLLYPLPYFRIEFDWTVPHHIIQRIYTEILYYPIYVVMNRSIPLEEIAQNMSFIEWFPYWISYHVRKHYIYCIITVIGFIVNVYLIIRHKDKYLFWLWLIMCINIVFWFVSAPFLRFGNVFLCLLFAISLSYLVPKYVSDSCKYVLNANHVFRTAEHVLPILCLIIFISYVSYLIPHKMLIYPNTLPEYKLRAIQAETKAEPRLTIYVSVDRGYCGDKELVTCPPAYCNLKLCARKPGDLGSGFYTEK